MKIHRDCSILTGLILLGLAFGPLSAPSQAQENQTVESTSFNETVVTEGVSRDVDKHHRGPVVSYSLRQVDQTAKIFAHIDIPNPKYQKYPVKVEFYVNRKLFATQILSPEQPGDLGIDVGPDIAVPPFSFAILAKLVHPNRSFSTSTSGIFEQESVQAEAKLSCELIVVSQDQAQESQNDDDVSDILITDDEVTFEQGSDNQWQASFIGTSDSSGSVPVTVTIAEANLDSDETAVIVGYTIDGVRRTETLEGSVEQSTSGELTFIDASSEEGETELVCDRAEDSQVEALVRRFSS